MGVQQIVGLQFGAGALVPTTGDALPLIDNISPTAFGASFLIGAGRTVSSAVGAGQTWMKVEVPLK